MAISGVGATPEPQGNTNINVKNSNDDKNVSIFAKQDVNTNGEITGEELLEKERFINDILFDFISDKINKLATIVKNYTFKYDATSEQSVKDAQEKTEEFIADINKQITDIKLEELKRESSELGEDEEISTMFTNYYDIDGNYHTYEYDKNGTLINSKVQTPEEMENAYNAMKTQYLNKASTTDEKPIIQENDDFNKGMQDLISKFEGATYKPHKDYNNIGAFRYNGEYVVIRKNRNNTYTVIRQHKTEQNVLEEKAYKNLNEMYKDLSSENYGWGSSTYEPKDKLYLRDLQFLDDHRYRPFGSNKFSKIRRVE